MKRHRKFLALIAVECFVLAGLYGHALWSEARAQRDELPAKQALVTALELTDLAFWTEARYTRHPSQADFFSPFQDFPSALEHFPAGSILAPARRQPPP